MEKPADGKCFAICGLVESAHAGISTNYEIRARRIVSIFGSPESALWMQGMTIKSHTQRWLLLCRQGWRVTGNSYTVVENAKMIQPLRKNTDPFIKCFIDIFIEINIDSCSSNK